MLLFKQYLGVNKLSTHRAPEVGIWRGYSDYTALADNRMQTGLEDNRRSLHKTANTFLLFIDLKSHCFELFLADSCSFVAYELV